MKDFRLYDIMDFVMDEDFIRWVQEKRPEDEAWWNNWLKAHPEKHLLVAEASRILESIRIGQRTFTPEEIDVEALKLLHTINGQSAIDMQRRPLRSITRQQWLAAAVISGLILLAVTFWMPGKTDRQASIAEAYTYSHQTAERSLIEQVNTSDKPITVLLADSSVVELSVNSRISYPRKFDSGTRDIYLSGEAFFKVTKNPNLPFRVFAHELVTKVLGTSFYVRSFEKDSVIQVTVKTGKVSVYSQANTPVKETSSPDKLSGIILTPNQQLTYRKEGQQFQKVLLEQPAMIVPAMVDRNMTYEDTRVEQVFDQISKAYGINIVYDSELLKNCTVTADLRNESFYDKLDLVCRAIGAGYEVIDGQVVIQTSGCL